MQLVTTFLEMEHNLASWCYQVLSEKKVFYSQGHSYLHGCYIRWWYTNFINGEIVGTWILEWKREPWRWLEFLHLVPLRTFWQAIHNRSNIPCYSHNLWESWAYTAQWTWHDKGFCSVSTAFSGTGSKAYRSD